VGDLCVRPDRIGNHCLRKVGWKEVWIWLAQARLFWLGHFYALFNSRASFWLIIPLTVLLLAWLALRARSVAPGMLAHGLANGLSQFIAW